MSDNTSNQQPPIQWPTSQPKGQTEAVDLARNQVEALFDQSVSTASDTPRDTKEHQTPTTTTSDMKRQVTPPASQQLNFYEYHTAWQSYYQNYFQQYYDRAYQQAKKTQNAANDTIEPEHPDSETTQTVTELKQKLRQTVEKQANKVKTNRHFKPALASISVGLAFLLINYNQVVFGAARRYINPSSTANTPLIMTPGATTAVSKDPTMTIPKIGVNAPVVYSETSFDEARVDKALEKGVVHYGTLPLPGENGNAVFLGHSSNNVFSAGDYKYVFVNLDKMDKGDIIYINYNGIRYTYKVTVAHKVVKPTDLSVLAASSKPIITLITCTPAGTNINRLIVQAEQIDPSPTKNKSITPDTQPEPENLPATSKSLWGNLF